MSNANVTSRSARIAIRVPLDVVEQIIRVQSEQGLTQTQTVVGLLRVGIHHLATASRAPAPPQPHTLQVAEPID